MTDLLNKVTQGDCLEVMRGIPDKSVDMVLCDLPYGTTACKWDTVIPFEPLWEQYNRVIKDNGAIVLTASQPFTTVLINSNLNNFKYCWVWNKRFAGNFAIAKYQPMKIHEDVCVFGKGRGKIVYNPQMTKRDKPIVNGGNKCISESAKFSSNSRVEGFKKVYTEKYPESILFHPRERGFHPTQKPVALFEYLISTYTNEGDIVLDNCIGSGTTAVAAINTGRQFIGVERESEYVDIANKRIADALSAKGGN